MTIAAWLGGLTRGNDRDDIEASPAARLTAAFVKSEARRILERGPTLADAATLYLAAAHDGGMTAALTPWNDIWPSLFAELPDEASPEAAAILDAAKELGDALAERRAANRAEPDVDRHFNLVLEAARGSAREHDAAQVHRWATINAQSELDIRRSGAGALVEHFEKRLRDALKSAYRSPW